MIREKPTTRKPTPGSPAETKKLAPVVWRQPRWCHLLHPSRRRFQRSWQAEAVEALLYGCMTWSPRRNHYGMLQTTHHRLLLRVIGYRRKRGTYRQLSYAQALKRVGCQSVEATVRQRRLLFAGAVARQPDGRLPKRLMFGELVGGENPGRGSPEQNWLICLKDDLKVFGATQGSTDDAPCVFGVPKLV